MANKNLSLLLQKLQSSVSVQQDESFLLMVLSREMTKNIRGSYGPTNNGTCTSCSNGSCNNGSCCSSGNSSCTNSACTLSCRCDSPEELAF